MNDLTQGGEFNHGGRHGVRGLDRIPLGSLVAGDDTTGQMFYVDANKEVARLEIVAVGAVLASGTIPSWKTNVPITGWVRVGSTTTPTNVTAGDLTSVRVIVGDATLASGVVLAAAGNTTVTGYVGVGSATAPSNTTAGDLTALRAHFGTDGAFTSGKELEVVGDALISDTFQVGGNAGFYGHAVAAQGTGGENVTNSVTNSGSTAGTIPDITDGVTYANDYVNLRRALFQIARMLKQDHDQLRAMGILT